MAKVTLPPDYETEIYRCVRCGFCTPYCPIFDAKGIESWNCRGRIIIEKALIQGALEVTEDVLDRLYTCSMCKICETNCPAKIQVVPIQEYVRKALVQQGFGPLKDHVELKENILTHGNIAGKAPSLLEKPFSDLVIKLPDDSPNLLFSGCVGTFNYPTAITFNTIQLLQYANVDFTMLKAGETCCSGFLKVVGLTTEFETIGQKNIIMFEEKGIERIISPCPMCYTTFHQEYPHISNNMPIAQHLVQVLEEVTDNASLQFERSIDAKIAVHDGCHLGRYSNLYEPPRKILESIPGVELVELPRSKEQASCCGGTIRRPYIALRDHLSDTIINQAQEVGADMVVTTCPTCYHNIKSAGIMRDTPVVNITTVVAYSTKLVNNL
ncbi:MAG: (Fe-S)-binding protein [Candidatus Heimdallarchaeota archaeon]